MKFYIGLIILLFPIISFSQTQISEGEVSGTWTKSGSPYIINGDVTVDTQGILTIEPGVEVEFSDNFKFYIYGRLLAEGTRADSIRFTASDASLGWGGLRFIGQDDNNVGISKISYASFSNGKASVGEGEDLSGGAIFMKNASTLSIRNTHFYNNSALGELGFGGGAICLFESSPEIMNSTFRYNQAVNNDGGAILLSDSDASILQSEFIGNSAASFGGAICVYSNSLVTLKHLEIVDNSAGDYGGGIYVSGNVPLLFSYSEITGNSAAKGGGVYISSSNSQTLSFTNLRISNNSSSNSFIGGDGVFIDGDVIFVNCIIDHNTRAGGDDTPIGLGGSNSLSLINCVVADNECSDVINGASSDYWELVIKNSIIWHNDNGVMDMASELHMWAEYSILQYPWDHFILGADVEHSDPEFGDHTAGNYHLSESSPAIDAGNSNADYNDEYLYSSAGQGTLRNDMGAYGGKHASWKEEPEANFVADVTVGEAPFEVDFTDMSLNVPAEYHWDFDNDGTIDSYEQNPTYTYEEGGVYSVRLTVITDDYTDTYLIENYITAKGNDFFGPVSGVWDLDTIRIVGDIVVPLNETLTIDPGTKVYFKGQYKFDVLGQLLANGTENDSIFFFSDSLGRDEDYNQLGHWWGMGFKNIDLNNSPKSELSYCDFKYALSKEYNNWEADLDSDSIGAPIRLYKSSNVSLKHLTISECDSYFFGSIHLINSSPEISNIAIKNMKGSIYLRDNSNASIKNIAFSEARIVITDSSPIIDSLLIENYVGVPLIGINFDGEVKNSVFRNNMYYSQDGGGAFSLFDASSPKFENVLFEGNQQLYSSGYYGFGGAGFIRDSSPQFVNCEFIGNTAQGGGGAIAVHSNDYSQPWVSTFDNCLFVNNRVLQGAGTITTSTNAAVRLTNCTIADNTASWDAGISNDSGSPNIMTNTIVYGNGPNFDQQISLHWAAYQFEYNIIQGNYYGRDETSTNIHDVDPLFRDAANGDYHLQSIACGDAANSPGIDTGDPTIADLALDCETAGLGTYSSDIGAYGGANNRWDNDIMPLCSFSGEVSGVWDCETITIEGDITIPEGDTLIITDAVDWVLITGPYQITVQGVLLAYGPENDITDLGSEHITFQGPAQSSGEAWHGIVFNNLNDKEVGTSIIKNCRFDYANRLNAPNSNGGALLIYNSDDVIVKQSVFYANAGRLGGAIYIENSDAYIEDCYFQLNGKEVGQTAGTITTAGGAMYIKNSNPYLHKLQFYDNYSISGGGAVILDNSSPTISNIIMARNYTGGLGGGMQCFNGSSPTLVNMTSADNIAETAGGSFYLNPDSNPTIINSIMYGSTKPEIYLGGGIPSITYSIIDAASSESYFGNGCLDENPYFATGTNYKLSNNNCSYSDGNNVISIAIDAGHPDSLDLVLDCYQGLGTQRADMGYYGGGLSTIHVGIVDLSKTHTFNIYPNPTRNSVTLDLSMESIGSFRYSIYNLVGQMLEIKNVTGVKRINIDFSAYKAGIYFIKLEIEDEVYMRQIIKK